MIQKKKVTDSDRREGGRTPTPQRKRKKRKKRLWGKGREENHKGKRRTEQMMKQTG